MVKLLTMVMDGFILKLQKYEIKISIRINIYLKKNNIFAFCNILRKHSKVHTLKTMLWSLLNFFMCSNYCCLQNNIVIHF